MRELHLLIPIFWGCENWKTKIGYLVADLGFDPSSLVPGFNHDDTLIF